MIEIEIFFLWNSFSDLESSLEDTESRLAYIYLMLKEMHTERESCTCRFWQLYMPLLCAGSHPLKQFFEVTESIDAQE